MVPGATGRAGGGLTIENGALEEADELEKHVLLLGRELVPAGLLAAALDLEAAETLLHVGLDPVGRRGEVALGGGGVAGLAALPEGPPRALLGLLIELLLALTLVGVPVVVDEADKTRVWG